MRFAGNWFRLWFESGSCGLAAEQDNKQNRVDDVNQMEHSSYENSQPGLGTLHLSHGDRKDEVHVNSNREEDLGHSSEYWETSPPRHSPKKTYAGGDQENLKYEPADH